MVAESLCVYREVERVAERDSRCAAGNDGREVEDGKWNSEHREEIRRSEEPFPLSRTEEKAFAYCVDNATLKRLTLDSAIVGGAGVRNGVERVSVRSWAPYTSHTGPSDFTERGFAATARVQDRVAQVWVPYDLYTGKTWSHCGVDAFTLLKSEGRWRVASLIYTIEQPPACQKHPAGPPTE